MNRRNLLRVLLILILLLLAVITLNLYNNYEHGTVLINLQLPNTQNISATLNGKPFVIKGLNAEYRLHRGTQDLVISKTGYKTTSTKFNVTPGTSAVTIKPVGVTPRDTTIATSQLAASLAAVIPSSFFVQQSQFFYSNTWAVVTIDNQQQDTAILVANYVGGSIGWKIVLGPGTLFSQSDMTKVPPDVATYMSEQNYIDEAE